MHRVQTVEILQRLGFGEYEARAYMTLLQRSPMTGYELARLSGIPRPNVYDLLPKLEERGAVLRADSPSGARYSAVSPSELIATLAGRFNDDLTEAEVALASATNTLSEDYAWNVEGRRSAIDHARTLIDSAQSEVLIAVWPQESRALASNVAQAEERGVAITTLCLAACSPECGGCRGSIHRYLMQEATPQEVSRWLVIASDSKEMLAGEIRTDDAASAVRTNKRLLIELASSYVRNSVALATLISDLGDRLPDLLSPGANSMLSALGANSLAGGWLQHMVNVLSASNAALHENGATSATERLEGEEEPTDR